MSLDDKARKLAENLHEFLEEAEAADRRNQAIADKLSPQEAKVLRTVGREECCVMSGIARAICLSLSSVTGLIDRLVEKKLVKRDRAVDDRRVVQVELTDQGRQLAEAALEGRVRFARELLKTLDAQEQETLLSLFGKISERLQQDKKPA